MREELFRLQSENERLRHDLTSRDNWDSQKAQYRLQETSGGAMVYESVGPPKHYACPVCFAKNTIQILQDRRAMSGVFDCPNCNAVYPIKPRRSVPISGGTAKGSLSAWGDLQDR